MDPRTKNTLYLIGLACSIAWGIVVGGLLETTVYQVIVAAGGAVIVLIVLAVLGVFDDLISEIRGYRTHRELIIQRRERNVQAREDELDRKTRR